MVLFAVASIADMSVGRLSRALLPYLAGITLVLLMVIIFPWVSVWLPDLVTAQ
jgi:TRAP-type C4-dicarboxylate transport system permease large subunit